jgi:hypothetical protein
MDNEIEEEVEVAPTKKAANHSSNKNISKTFGSAP